MCCFSGPVRVAGTRIFARTARNGWQGIVYEMQYTSDAPVAMVLPLPCVRGAGVEDGETKEPLRFVDLSSYPDFFKKLADGFVNLELGGSDHDRLGVQAAALKVERVGSFEASFVPSVSDFQRLDGRFRMSDEVWRSLPTYANWSFAVFQLSASKRAEVHPMSFIFKSASPERVFFPTVHVHDGRVEEKARFDHMLYLQSAVAPVDWRQSNSVARKFVDVDRAQRLVRGSAHVHRVGISGMRANQDIWVPA